tara:strand:+ start:1616 stop:2512 length:897 start_codon:yes stop_codon:yes gene_type:complete
VTVSAALETLYFEQGSLTFSAQTLGSGPLVLCLHGFPDNAGSFRHQLPAVAAAGYRGISLTLRGYEPSSIPPDGDYSIETIAGDVVTLIRTLTEGPVHLIGHDWGAAVAYNAAAAAPECFRSVTTMAVPHAGRFARDGLRILKQLRLSWYMGFFNIPWLSDWVVQRKDYAFIRKLWRDWSPDWHPEPHALESVVDTLSQPGVRSAALGYYRAALSLSALLAGKDEAHFKVPVPTLALSGERDGCIASDVFEQLTVPEDFPAGVTFRRIPDAGHFLHQERPDVVNALILDWLRAHHDQP